MIRLSESLFLFSRLIPLDTAPDAHSFVPEHFTHGVSDAKLYNLQVNAYFQFAEEVSALGKIVE